MTNADIQRALLRHGFDPKGIDGVIGKNTIKAIISFQAARGLVQSGMVDAATRAALSAPLKAETAPAASTVSAPSAAGGDGPVIPTAWMPPAQMRGIVVHWTAGQHRASVNDRSHYHFLIEGDGGVIRGLPSVDLNGLPRAKKGYAAHTRNCNTGFIGVSLCCMAGAVESPFSAGPQPMTPLQWQRLPHVLAALCRRYGIAVTPQTVLSHAEVQPTLKIAQRGKWDITRIAFDPSIVGARACGDAFRSATSALLA
jgi:N-acetyl-anhydromuramyl-L-alanine amidase AmpD